MRRRAIPVIPVILVSLAVVLAALAVRAFAVLLAGPHFPLGEDMLGHTYKSTILLESLQSGRGVPIMFPGWYAGSESFRYWPHLPYLLLAVPLALAPGDPGLAVIVVIVIGLAGGAAGVLLWRRQLGWPLAILGAVLSGLLADPLRVAFAEGNLGRVVANALFLPELALAILVVQSDRWHRWLWPALGLIAIAMISVLCHAMMAAAAGVAIMLVLAVGLLVRRWSLLPVVGVGVLIAIGTALAGWWLLPSLGGGIEVNSGEAVRKLFDFDFAQSFYPFAATDVATFTGRARFYIGLALVVTALAALVHGGPRGRGFPFIVAGLVLVAVTIDPLPIAYNRLPFSYLLWPIRMQSLGQALLLLGVLFAAAELLRTPAQPQDGRRRRYGRLAAVALLCLIALDTVGNLSLVAGRPTPPAQLAVRDRLVALPGWREATLELSRLGSSPTLLWRDREQLYGWGIQGARNMIEIVDLNEALERRNAPSVVARLDWWGVDDAVFDREEPELEAALADRGYAIRGLDGTLRHWGRAGGPRAVTLSTGAALGVGRNLRVWTQRFPQVVRADTAFIDDLRLADLRRTPTLVLAWPRWRDRARAEALVLEYVAGGGRVVVELSGSRADADEGTSRFLGVEAVRVPFPSGVTVEGPAGNRQLLPFDETEGAWLATRYQGEIVPTGAVRVGGPEPAIVFGTSRRSDRISFVGLNLPFHAQVRGDTAADELLERETGLQRRGSPVAATIPLEGYSVSDAVYRFALTIDRPQPVVVPVARHERMTVSVNGAVTPIVTLNDSVVLDLDAGRHEVAMRIEQGGNRTLGAAVSVAALVAAIAVLLVGRRPLRPRSAIRSRGWLITPKESQRVEQLALAGAGVTQSGPYVVVLAEVRNIGKLPAPFDPRVVDLVGRHGRPFPLARGETHALGATLAQLRPGEIVEPGVPRLATLVYLIPAVIDRWELVGAAEVNASE